MPDAHNAIYVDNNHFITPKPGPKPEFYPHQIKALKDMRDGCILWGGVGSGKSRTALGYYCLTDAHEDVYIITTAKKRDSNDWEDEALQFGISTKADASFYGKLTVDSWNNLHKYVEVENAFFIFDEQRLVGSGKWVKAFLKVAKKNRWIMLSATPGDNWLDYIPVFVANGFYRNRTAFKAEHVVYKPYMNYPVVDHYVNVGKLVRHRNQILVHMPYLSETKRNSVNVWCEFNEEDLIRVAHGRWDIFNDEPVVNVAQLFYVMRRVVNSDPSRIVELDRLVRKHPRLIVFYNFNYELDILRDFGINLIHGSDHPRTLAEWNGQNHEEIPDSEAWLYFVQYQAGAEGWNCVSTDATCFFSLPYSYKLWEQAHGRIDRLNTTYTDLFYYVMRSKAPIDHAIWRSLKAKKKFQPDHFDFTNAEFADFAVK